MSAANRPPATPRLAAELAARGWSDRYVARRLRLYDGAVGDIITGKLWPTADVRQRFADMFGVDADELFRPTPEVEYLLGEMSRTGHIIDADLLHDVAVLARPAHRRTHQAKVSTRKK